MVPSTFAKRLAQIRKDKGISQAKLAEMLNKSAGTTGGYETGKSYPSAEVLIELSELLNCSIDYLLLGKTKKQK